MSGFLESVKAGKMFKFYFGKVNLECEFIICQNRLLIEFFHRLFVGNSILFQLGGANCLKHLFLMEKNGVYVNVIEEVDQVMLKVRSVLVAIDLFDLFRHDCRWIVLWALKNSPFSVLPNELHRHILEFSGDNDFTKSDYFWHYMGRLVLGNHPYVDPFLCFGDRVRMIKVHERKNLKNRKNVVFLSTNSYTPRVFLGRRYCIAKAVQRMGVSYSVKTDQSPSSVYLDGEVTAVFRAFDFLMRMGSVDYCPLCSGNFNAVFTVRFFEFEQDDLMEVADDYYNEFSYLRMSPTLRIMGTYGVTFGDTGERIHFLLKKLSERNM